MRVRHWNLTTGFTRAAVVVATAGAITLFPVAPAHADGSTDGKGGGPAIDRVIDRGTEQLPVSAAARAATAQEQVAERGTIPLPAGVKVRAGEAVQVNYADGVAVFAALDEDCAVSVTVGTPKKTSSGYAQATHQISVGSGCDGASSGTGKLYSWTAFWGTQLQNQVTKSADPGWRVSWTTNKQCNGTGTTGWKSATTAGLGGDLANSKQVNLACGI